MVQRFSRFTTSNCHDALMIPAQEYLRVDAKPLKHDHSMLKERDATMTSKPRPIHQPPREIRSTPDDTEPSYSYEQESFLPKSEDEIEDQFFRRLNSRENFWRSSDGGSVGPSFSSMNMRQRSDSTGNRASSGEGDERPVVNSPPPTVPNPVSDVFDESCLTKNGI